MNKLKIKERMPMRVAITAKSEWYVGAIKLFMEHYAPDCEKYGRAGVQSLNATVTPNWPDLVVVGVPNRNLVHAKLIEDMRSKWPHVPLCVIASDHFPGIARQVQESGALVYLTTETEPADVKKAFEYARQGHHFFCEEAKEPDVEPIPPHLPENLDDKIGKLTRRERQVMELLGRGYANREIAELLELREGTVRIYVHRVIRQLGLRNRVDVALCANYASHYRTERYTRA